MEHSAKLHAARFRTLDAGWVESVIVEGRPLAVGDIVYVHEIMPDTRDPGGYSYTHKFLVAKTVKVQGRKKAVVRKVGEVETIEHNHHCLWRYKESGYGQNQSPAQCGN